MKYYFINVLITKVYNKIIKKIYIKYPFFVALYIDTTPNKYAFFKLWISMLFEIEMNTNQINLSYIFAMLSK